jgi:prepilin-type N-terminal cleavage/methylation domain-containing protein
MKANQKGFTLFELIYVLVFFSIVGGIAYVFVHFISKFW